MDGESCGDLGWATVVWLVVELTFHGVAVEIYHRTLNV